MIILVHTKYNSDNIQNSIGQSEYSYYFVLKKFLPVLREIGEVVVVENPTVEVEAYFNKASEEGRSCVYLSFTAPHNLYIDSNCPTIPVFAWEYDTIPNESWDGNEKNNWVKVLQKVGAAITHSEHSVKVVQEAVGKDFPIIACPAPMEAHYYVNEEEVLKKTIENSYEITLTQQVIDSKVLEFGQLNSAKGVGQRIEITHALLQTWAHEVIEDVMPPWLYRSIRRTYLFAGTAVARTIRFLKNLNRKFRKDPVKEDTNNPAPIAPTSTIVEGIIYTSILNIFDERKNYQDMVAAFCQALKDNSDATLILKTPVLEDLYFFKQKVISFLEKLAPFNCRVVFIGDYLDKDTYLGLMKATTFYVNTSFGEGQCLPLMEYMAAGVPAIAPFSTAMQDYLTDANAFLLDTATSPSCWQHDERMAIRTVQHRPDWYALVEAYRASYQLAKASESAYRIMSLQATEAIKQHASSQKMRNKLGRFLNNRLTNPGRLSNPN